jgi:hypothetical protein
VNVWAYTLRDVSLPNVQAIVTHPDVVDTHHIDRLNFSAGVQAPPMDDPILGVSYLPAFQYPGWTLFVTAAIAAWLLALVLPHVAGRFALTAQPSSPLDVFVRRSDQSSGPHSRSAGLSCRHAALALTAFVVPFGLWSARPTLSPLSLRPMPPFGIVSSPRSMMESLPCTTREQMAAPFTEYDRGKGPTVVKSVLSCAPPYVLMQWMEANVPVDAVLAVNRWNHHLPSMFMPQQVVAYPGFEPSFVNEERLFEGYYRFYHRSMRTFGVQPFFNAVESDAERFAFIRALGVTHVLVDPASYNEMRGVLSLRPDVFDLKYADGRWAVYSVTPQPR